MVSDIHFEPFGDPGKAAKLASTAASGWEAVLAAAPSADRDAQLAALEQACPTRGDDTSYPLFASSLRAMSANAERAIFVTVSGDLISHSFNCKFAKVFPNAKPGEYRAFVEKTIEFVVGSMRTALPGVPVYASLGNNDSDCGDYQLDANSTFLAETGMILTGDVTPADAFKARSDFAVGGNFAVSLPEPFAHARLMILDDLFMARNYKACAEKQDWSEATRQIAWLRSELESARQKQEKVWVMSHIPPGVDAFGTAKKGKNVCGGDKPTMFLANDDLTNALAAYGDVVTLAIFAHTHMDEMRLIAGAGHAGANSSIPVKLVPSISPIDGNNPSITVAQVDPRTATLVDYKVMEASNQTGVDTKWSQEYGYGQAYSEPAFSSRGLTGLMEKFKADPGAKTPASEAYIHNYFVGDRSAELAPFWGLEICALTNLTADSFKGCVCGK
jgi:sphingomyelin phosphodiesterase acid-like 3